MMEKSTPEDRPAIQRKMCSHQIAAEVSSQYLQDVPLLLVGALLLHLTSYLVTHPSLVLAARLANHNRDTRPGCEEGCEYLREEASHVDGVYA